MTTEVVIVDDDELFRRGICDWLSTISTVEVVGDASGAEEFLQLVDEHSVDIALIDVLLPGLTGLDLCAKIRETRPDVRCIMLAGAATSDLVFASYEAGASGFLPKQCSSEELAFAIERVASGDWYISSLIAEEVLRSTSTLRDRVKDLADEDDPTLSSRERELLKLIAEGHTFAEIARHLSINSRSVERLKAKLEQKLNASSLVDLIREAIKKGLVQP